MNLREDDDVDASDDVDTNPREHDNADAIDNDGMNPREGDSMNVMDPTQTSSPLPTCMGSRYSSP